MERHQTTYNSFLTLGAQALLCKMMLNLCTLEQHHLERSPAVSDNSFPFSISKECHHKMTSLKINSLFAPNVIPYSFFNYLGLKLLYIIFANCFASSICSISILLSLPAYFLYGCLPVPLCLSDSHDLYCISVFCCK